MRMDWTDYILGLAQAVIDLFRARIVVAVVAYVLKPITYL